MFESHMCLI